MTLAENVLRLKQYTRLSDAEIRELCAYKLAGRARRIRGFYPRNLRRYEEARRALRALMAMDPDILFFDEPSAGLDRSARLLDDLILELRDSLLGTTVVDPSRTNSPASFRSATTRYFSIDHQDAARHRQRRSCAITARISTSAIF
jgi:phospholipid/cholesterol/gamma-HCH transport system ATP-binding protein